MSVRAYGVLTALLVLAGCTTDAPRGGAVKKAEIGRVRDVLRMEYPYRVRSLGSYLDGGTVGVVVVDSWGQTLSFCADGRMRPVPRPSLGIDTLRMTLRHFFIGATHPNEKGARQLPIGGTEELALLDMLEVMSLDYFTQDMIDSIAMEQRQQVRSGRNPSDTSAPMTEEMAFALRAGLLAWGRRRADPAGQIIWIRGS